MKEVVIDRILEILERYKTHEHRWRPVKEFLFTTVSDKQPRKERKNKEIDALEIDTQLLEKLSDVALVICFEKVCKQYYTQM